MDVTAAVDDRYSAAALALQPALCCPVAYDQRLLAAIPVEVLERDYGCGDPSPWLRPGDRVLDLGCGGGKLCFIASQLVGASGQVIGIDRNRAMLALARGAAPVVAGAIGYANAGFRRGEIADLALDLDAVGRWLAAHPVHDTDGFLALRAEEERLRREQPLIADGSIDVVVSNCVLNLVVPGDRPRLFTGLHRVLRDGGRVAISDIVADAEVPAELQADPTLWSGCISGAFREDRLLEAFVTAGFHGVQLVRRAEAPWRVVAGIEFHAVTVMAWKGKAGPCREGNHAILYPGPWSEVRDDDGHVFTRGQRTAVCAKTYRLLTSEPYRAQVVGLPPYRAIAEHEQGPFSCTGTRQRTPAETRNGPRPPDYRADQDCCGPGGTCG